jgi:hypothetical protein
MDKGGENESDLDENALDEIYAQVYFDPADSIPVAAKVGCLKLRANIRV